MIGMTAYQPQFPHDMTELNSTLTKLEAKLRSRSEDTETSMKLLEIIEMLVDRREEESLLVIERLEEIIKKQK